MKIVVDTVKLFVYSFKHDAVKSQATGTLKNLRGKNIMKMKKEHFEYMQTTLTKFVLESGFPDLSQYKEKGLTEKRYRWDLSYSAKLTPWICKNLYSYLNDDHIDTALRVITGTK